MLIRDWTTSSNFINFTGLNNEHKWTCHVIIEEINKHAFFLITIINSGEVRLLLMLNHGLANATQVPFHFVNLIERNLENIYKSNNTHIP